MRKTVADLRAEGFNEGVQRGRQLERQELFATKTSADLAERRARIEMTRAAAELAQANAKLTYALSRILNEKGW